MSRPPFLPPSRRAVDTANTTSTRYKAAGISREVDPWARLPGWTATDGIALLHQLRGAEVYTAADRRGWQEIALAPRLVLDEALAKLKIAKGALASAYVRLEQAKVVFELLQGPGR